MKSNSRVHFVKSDYGVEHYYSYFRKRNKNKTSINRNLFGLIVNEYNNYVRDRIAKKGAGYIMPSRLGKIELRKIKTEVSIDEDGKASLKAG